jgi:hypothetical protein
VSSAAQDGNQLCSGAKRYQEMRGSSGLRIQAGGVANRRAGVLCKHVGDAAEQTRPDAAEQGN